MHNVARSTLRMLAYGTACTCPVTRCCCAKTACPRGRVPATFEIPDAVLRAGGDRRAAAVHGARHDRLCGHWVSALLYCALWCCFLYNYPRVSAALTVFTVI